MNFEDEFLVRLRSPDRAAIGILKILRTMALGSKLVSFHVKSRRGTTERLPERFPVSCSSDR